VDGKNETEIIGPALVEEGLRVFRDYDFPTKLLLRQEFERLHWKNSDAD
jgi:hypothetical protein